MITRRRFLQLSAALPAAAVLLPAARPAEAEAELDVIEVKPEDSPLWAAHGAYMEAQVKAKAEELEKGLWRLLYAQYDWCDCYYCRLGRRR